MKKLSNYSGKNINLLSLMLVELCIVVTINLITMIFSYFFDGEKGVDKIVNSLNDQFNFVGLVAVAINCLIGLIFWLLHRYFNFQHKNFLKEVSEGLLDTSIALYRLAGGILISFAIIYLFAVGYEHILLVFILYGLISVVNSTFLVFFKKKLFLKPDRKLVTT
ncbi:hypothetical protein VRP79_003792, partial [Acinetobacter baumannii]|nr:hypothetical protein [Acinetobacter baumannii]